MAKFCASKFLLLPERLEYFAGSAAFVMAGLRIIAGKWRGKSLIAPPGIFTRPTNIRVRQAVFDILLHAPWAGHSFVQSAYVLDAFAGTGAYGLEALSRGAVFASFIESNPEAIICLRDNIAGCKAQKVSNFVAADALMPPPGIRHDLIFLDPPYAQNLVPNALAALSKAGYFAENAVFVAEFGPGDDFTPPNLLTVRQHGKARIVFWRHMSDALPERPVANAGNAAYP